MKISNEYYIKNGFSLFWGGPYSQWETYDIIYQGMTFNCNEQFMMYFKALVCEDYNSAKLIMNALFPHEQKKLGRQIKNFSEDIWTEEVSMAVVYIANYLKFTQYKSLRKYLIDDPSKEIVEASPYDKIWGIGLSADKPQAWHKNSWRGENRLGRCITKVRNTIIDSEDYDITWHNKCCQIVNDIFNSKL